MFFLLRCVFWLGLVFAHMPWNGLQIPHGLPAPAAAGRTVLQMAATSAGDLCTARPLDCIEAARKLQLLFEKVASENESPPGTAIDHGATDAIVSGKGQPGR